MSEKTSLYIVFGSSFAHIHAAHAALDIVVTRLKAIGFDVDTYTRALSTTKDYSPLNVIFTEHMAPRPLLLDAGVQPGNYTAPKIKPPVIDAVMSYRHPLQVSVIGPVNSGKTTLMHAMTDWLQVENPVHFSLDNNFPQTVDMSMVNDFLQGMVERTRIQIRHLNLDASCDLDRFFIQSTR